MIGKRPTIEEFWLRAACLAVSVGLHAGLGVLGWQGLHATPAEDGPVMVALVDKPTAGAPSPGRPLRTARLNESVRPAAPKAAPLPSAPQVKAAPAVDPLCAVAEATVIEAAAEAVAFDGAPAAADGAAGDNVSDGAGSGSGPAGSGGGRRGGEVEGAGGGLIKATPRYETNPLPSYPRLARQNRWEGTVRLRARVSAEGEVEGLALERSSGHAVLDRSALDGVQRWRFIPARQGGMPVACEVSIPVAFQLKEP